MSGVVPRPAVARLLGGVVAVPGGAPLRPVTVAIEAEERARIARDYEVAVVPAVKTVAPAGLCGEVVFRRGIWFGGGR